MGATCVTAVRSRRDLERFLALPYALHRGDPCWTPPLRRDARRLVDPERHPFYRHAERELFLARAGGRVVGRIAAIHDRLHLERHADGAGMFGFFECVDHQGTATALVEAAAGWLRARSLRVMRGPFSPSINEEVGLLVEGFDTPSVVMMAHNPRHYPALVAGAGLRGTKDLLAFESTHTDLPPRLVAATELLRKRHGIRCRRLDLRRFAAELELVRSVFNGAWQRNWGFVPLTDEEIAQLAAQLRPIVVPEIVAFAERAGKPVGFAAAIPDLNVALRANRSGRLFPGILKVLWRARRLSRIRVLLLGVLPEWQGKGVDALLYRHIWEEGRKKGYDWAEAGWVLEDNHPMINGLARMGFRPYKRYRIYERPL